MKIISQTDLNPRNTTFKAGGVALAGGGVRDAFVTSGESDRQPVSYRQMLSAARGGGATRAVSTGPDTISDLDLAKELYGAQGDSPYDLRERQDVLDLISSSPQLDDLNSTTHDSVRCGGAAIFNGLLLDGNSQANAGALSRVAGERGVEISKVQQQALDAMKSGQLTPHQAAQLQELTYSVADSFDSQLSGGGLYNSEIASTLDALVKQGALGNTKTLSINGEYRGLKSNGDYQSHATVTSTVQGKDGSTSTVTADSLPDLAGAEPAVREGRGPVLSDPKFVDRVTYMHGKNGPEFEEFTAYDSNGNPTFGPVGTGTTAVVEKTSSRGNTFYLNPKTAAPLSSERQQEFREKIANPTAPIKLGDSDSLNQAWPEIPFDKPGGSLLRALLNEEDHRANANALEKVADERNLDVSKEQKAALDSMRRGLMSLDGLDQIRQLGYSIADQGDANKNSAEGNLSDREYREAQDLLTKNGAFPNRQTFNLASPNTQATAVTVNTGSGPGFWGRLWNGIKNGAEDIGDAIGDAGRSVSDGLGKVYTGLGNAIQSVGGNIGINIGTTGSGGGPADHG
ncbi:MAG: hypothetical protein KF760_33275 [Candidatus Eremiobacteraeota bacterium]|nr:hypothetical protein [Candidatus Eremiobacteraeota bacterium]MCW5869078.1 hypothetical protein [Candidatus Eremiobacteraeota bacterium]